MLFRIIKMDSSPNFDSGPHLRQWTLNSILDPYFDIVINFDIGP
jgi:hypothetical protein